VDPIYIVTRIVCSFHLYFWCWTLLVKIKFKFKMVHNVLLWFPGCTPCFLFSCLVGVSELQSNQQQH